MDPSQIDPNMNVTSYEQIAEMRKRQRMADSLRRKSEMIGSQRLQPTVNVTQGNDNFPGMVQANVAGNVANAVQLMLGAHLENKAADSEMGAEDARLATLQQMLGNAGQVGPDGRPQPMGMEQAVALTDMGIHPSIVREAMDGGGASSIVKNLHSYAKNPAAIRALVNMGQLPPEVGEQMIADLEKQTDSTLADKASLIEFAARLKPDRQPSEMEMWMQDPQKVEEYWSRKNAKGRDPEDLGRLSPQEMQDYRNINKELESSATKLENLSGMVRNIQGDPTYFSTPNRAAEALSAYARSHTGALGTFLESAARAMTSGTRLSVNNAVKDAVLNDMKMMGGNDSERELRTMLENYINSANDPQAAMEFLTKFEESARDNFEANKIKRDEFFQFDSTGRNRKYYSLDADPNPKATARSRRLANAEKERLNAQASKAKPQAAPAAPTSGGWEIVQ